MKYKSPSRICLAALIMACAAITNVFAGPSCDEQHELLAFTVESDHVFWIAVNRTGDCVASTLLKVVVRGDSLMEFQKFGYAPSQAKWTTSLLNQFKHEEPIVWNNPAEDWIQIDSNFSIKQPQPSRELLARFKQWNSSTIPANYWNKQEGLAGIDLPITSGDQLKLVYADSVGLYVKYRFKEVFYFPLSGYLVITTYNDRYAGEFDCENGFLLMHRKGAK